MEAIADALRARGLAPDQLRYVGARRGLEANVLANQVVELTLLPGRGLQRSFHVRAILDNLSALGGLTGAILIALYRVGRWRPAAVVSVGGYASFAAALAAVLWRRPLILVELDAAPGAAQRALGRFARRRCTAFPSDDPSAVLTGGPLRRSILALDRTPDVRRAQRATLDPPIDARRRVIVVMTGSLGAASVNCATLELARLWADRDDRTLWHVTGRRDYLDVLAARPATTALDYRLVDFADMSVLWSVADAAVCRAGSTTIGELTALGIPSILVPLPGAPGDHQTLNARSLVAAGGALLMRDNELSGASLARALDAICSDEHHSSMSAAAARAGHRDAAETIADVVLRVASGV